MTELDDLDEIPLGTIKDGNRGARVLRNALKNRRKWLAAPRPKWKQQLALHRAAATKVGRK